MGGEYYELFDLASIAAQELGVSAPRFKIPYPVALAVAFMAQTWSRLSGQPTAMSVEGIRVMNHRLRVSSEKAQKELGITFRPMRETIRDEVAWMRRVGMLESNSTIRAAASV
ncbi:MAG: hypothetical protein U0165_05925 [Polyangiaceae bacterium]